MKRGLWCLFTVCITASCQDAASGPDARPDGSPSADGAVHADATRADAPHDAAHVDAKALADAGSPTDARTAESSSPLDAPTDGTPASVLTQWGTVNEPALPASVCRTLEARLVPLPNGLLADAADQDPLGSETDTASIQMAIDVCSAGQAVKLVQGIADSGATTSGFLSGPLTLKSGVTLWIDTGVTLYASRNPEDYDKSDAGQHCGTATAIEYKSCNALITAVGTTGSGVVGGGTINGRGGSLLTTRQDGGSRSWWDLAWESEEGLHQQNPPLILVDDSESFTLYGVAIENAPSFHVLTENVTGLTAWGVKIISPTLAYTKPDYACDPGTTPGRDAAVPATCFTPSTVKNTDGFDPAESSQVLLAYSYISDGDDMVAIKSHNAPTSSQLAFLHNHFYYGHGLSIGSETDANVTSVLVEDLTIDGRNDSLSTGLHIKSDSAAGGSVSGVTYRDICMRNVRFPLLFDAYYEGQVGTKIPSFTGIEVSGLHGLPSTYGNAALPMMMTFAGYYDPPGQDSPLLITLENVVFDGADAGFTKGLEAGPAANPEATHFSLGGTVSFASSLVPSTAHDVTVSYAEAGVDASIPSCASAFVPYESVLPDAPF
jgi:polygalacturonase